MVYLNTEILYTMRLTSTYGKCLTASLTNLCFPVSPQLPALMSSPAHTRLDVSQAQVKQPVNTKKMHIPPHFAFESYTERAWFCCLVAGLGGSSALQKLVPTRMTYWNMPLTPKRMKEGTHRKSFWSCVGRNMTSV